MTYVRPFRSKLVFLLASRPSQIPLAKRFLKPRVALMITHTGVDVVSVRVVGVSDRLVFAADDGFYVCDTCMCVWMGGRGDVCSVCVRACVRARARARVCV